MAAVETITDIDPCKKLPKDPVKDSAHENSPLIPEGQQVIPVGGWGPLKHFRETPEEKRDRLIQEILDRLDVLEQQPKRKRRKK